MRVGDDVKLGVLLLIGAGMALIAFNASLRPPRQLPDGLNWRWLLALAAAALASVGLSLILYHD